MGAHDQRPKLLYLPKDITGHSIQLKVPIERFKGHARFKIYGNFYRIYHNTDQFHIDCASWQLCAQFASVWFNALSLGPDSLPLDRFSLPSDQHYDAIERPSAFPNNHSNRNI